MFKCDICNKEFETHQKLGGHIAFVHKRNQKLINKKIEKKKINVKKTCPKCNTIFEVKRSINKDGSESIRKDERKFCSRSCANSKNFTEKQNKAKGRKGYLNGAYIDGRSKNELFCADCGKKIKYNNKSGYCKKCYHKNIKPKITQEMRKKCSKNQLRLVKEGKHQGWKKRNKTSFPEDFFIKVLENNNFEINRDFIVNYPVSQKSLGLNNKKHYFLDFYFPKFKLDLEIDGRQHNDLDRKTSDKKRDELLKKNNYIVYRIKWKDINRPSGKKYIKEKIKDFINFYNKMPL